MQDILDCLDAMRPMLAKASDDIWDYAELAFQEHQSAALLKRILAAHGFDIQDEIAGMATAFCAQAGSGEPVIAYLGEYDALPDLSQKADVFTRDPIVQHLQFI